MIKRIFLDMDGVIADFVGGALDVHDGHHIVKDWPACEWDIAKLLGITNNEFWREINQRGSPFWSNLLPFPWMYELIESFGDIPYTISTKPSNSTFSVAGKLQWLHTHIKAPFKDYMMGGQKHLLAKPGTVLIDDNDTNVIKFREAGGHAILFPQQWNTNFPQQADRIGYVAKHLRCIHKDLEANQCNK